MKNDCCFTSANDWFRYRAAAIIIEENCVLLMGNEATTHLYTVGGAVHLGEKSEECIKREVFEEIGIEYDPDRLAAIAENFFTGKGNFLDGVNCHVIEFYYVMKSKGKKFRAKTADFDTDKSDVSGAGAKMNWIPLNELQNRNIKPEFLKTELPKIVSSNRILHVVTDADKIK